MKVIDADYNFRVGYWALKNNVQEYKICHSDTDIRLGFCEQFATSSWRLYAASQIDKPQI
jgi:hypothetical protein